MPVLQLRKLSHQWMRMTELDQAAPCQMLAPPFTNMQLAHLIGSHQWEMPSCTGFSRFRMGSHHLPVEEGRHFNLPRPSRVCNLCNTGA